MSVALICGGRNFNDADLLFRSLGDLRAMAGITSIVHGAAQGADTFAARWAEAHGIPARAFPANWVEHGRAAGPRRNQQMIDEGRPDLLIAFPGGAGTADVIQRARRAGIRIVKVVV